MKQQFSTTFLLMAIAFVVCLVVSNIFAIKVFTIGGITLQGADLIFPASYILNDCFVEVWGYRKARLVIWTGFAMNLFVVLFGQLVVWLPAAAGWDGAVHFNYVFNMAPRIAFASLAAFLAGSTLNAFVLSKMKVAQKGKGFSVRSILSSVAGDGLDSLIFLPIAFWGTATPGAMARLLLFQVAFKVCYELVILPVTNLVVRRLKVSEGIDTYDTGISYNPFRITDI